MPGVVVSTAVRTGPSSTTVRESSQFFVVGLAERGPSDTAVLVQSIADFESTFGGYISTSYLHPTVETFFEEGGTQAYVARTVGSNATTGLLVLSSSSASVMTLSANGAGAWSSDVAVSVTQPTGTTFRISFTYEGTQVYSTGTCSSLAQAAGRINISTVASKYINATVSAGATGIPAVITAVALSAGVDGNSTVVDAGHIASLALFNGALGSGAVSIPEDWTTAATVRDALVEHANNNNRIAILHSAAGSSTATAIADATSVQNGDNAEHAALYYPWIEVPTTVAGVSRVIPPDGYVAAKRAVAHNQTGSHVPAAGLLSAARFVSGVQVDIDKATGDTLDVANVNAIRIIQNTVRIYGARSLSADDDNFRYITTMDTVNHVVVESARTLEDLVFSTIDGRNTIFSAIESRLISILSPLRDAGALYEAYDANGRKIDPGFTVRCDAKLNPVSQLAGGTVKAKVGLRTSSVGDKIDVDIVKSNLTASVV